MSTHDYAPEQRSIQALIRRLRLLDDQERLHRIQRLRLLAAPLSVTERSGPKVAPTPHATAAPPTQVANTRETRLSPSRLKAYQQYQYALASDMLPTEPTDREAYDWLEARAEGDRLPSYATWSRYVRSARAAQSPPRTPPAPNGHSVIRDADR